MNRFQTLRQSPPRWLQVLQSHDAFGSPIQRAVAIALLLAWLAAIVLQSVHHEMWRDEMRFLSTALQPQTIWGLPNALENEGHPLLWYVMLRVGYLVFPSPVLLKVLAIAVAFGAAILLVRFAPFPLWQKILFLCGGLPAYEYSVMARNYGLSMLACFGFAALYPHRRQHPLWTAWVLAALAQTNVHAALLSAVLAAAWFADDLVFVARQADRRATTRAILALAIVAFSILLTMAISRPTEESIATRADIYDVENLVDGAFRVIRNPTESFRAALPDTSRLQRDALFLFLLLGLLVRPPLAAAFPLAVFTMGAVFTIVYPGYLRHEGLMIVFILTLYWICLNDFPRRDARPWATKLTRWAAALAVTILLAIQLRLSWEDIPRDWVGEKSSSLALGALLNSDPRLRDAILMGEPDYLLESVPYYADNRIYIPRESVFRDYTKFTTANREILTLETLLETASRVQREQRQPVLIAIGHEQMTTQPPPYEIRFPYHRIFRWTPESLSAFLAATEQVGAFHASQWENYDLYLLRSSETTP